jgi:RNA polymerase sigma-70 factor (ECF subfamily)
MLDGREEFEAMMARVRSGCPDAAQAVFDRFSPHVRRVVRRHLARRLRRQYDSIDFLQAVWASFFTIPVDRYTFDSPDDLVNFLARIAANKVIEAFRNRYRTLKNDINRERSIEAAPIASEPRCPGPSPSQLAIAEERWALLLHNQPPGRRRVLELLRQGHTLTEAAEQTGVHPKVIQRLLRKLNGRADAG